MTLREITNEALRRGLIDPKGKTPHATMGSVLYCHVRDAMEPRIERQAEQGPVRARRGSVVWRLIAEAPPKAEALMTRTCATPSTVDMWLIDSSPPSMVCVVRLA
jgi:hypothetical protein